MIDLTKQEYLQLPVGYCYQSSVHLNTDIYETMLSQAPERLLSLQNDLIDYVLGLVLNPLTEPDRISCDYADENGEVLQYYVDDKLLLEIDTYLTEGEYVLTCQYKVYRI